MKRFFKTSFTLFAAAFLTVSVPSLAPAQEASAPESSQQSAPQTSNSLKIAIIDLNKIIDNHPVSLSWDKELDRLKTERESEVRDLIKEKYGVTEESQLTDQQKNEVQRLIIMENEKFRQDMIPQRNEKLQKVEEDVIKFSSEIAKSNGFDYVFDRVAVIFGGEDITDKVIEVINKQYE